MFIARCIQMGHSLEIKPAESILDDPLLGTLINCCLHYQEEEPGYTKNQLKMNNPWFLFRCRNVAL